jgi:hypothetical protein
MHDWLEMRTITCASKKHQNEKNSGNATRFVHFFTSFLQVLGAMQIQELQQCFSLQPTAISIAMLPR